MKKITTTNILNLEEEGSFLSSTLGDSIAGESLLNINTALDEMYAECYTRIFRYFSFRLSSKENAEDLTQTVFLKIYSSLKNGIWNGQGRVQYIFTVARNTLIDHFRRNKHATIASDELVESVADTCTTSGPIEDRELREMLTDAMGNLRENEIIALKLRFFSDLDYRTIAKIMGKREDAIRQLVHRGLRSLKGYLKAF